LRKTAGGPKRVPDKTSKPDNVNAAVPARGADAVLAEHAAAIKALGKRVVSDLIEIGRRLTEVKQIVGHGNWLPWLDREFGWKESTALRYMRLHELASKSANLTDLDVPISGLYLLAAPSTPEPARTEIIARAEAGEKLPVAEVKRAIFAARGQQQPRSRQQPAKPLQLSRQCARDRRPGHETYSRAALAALATEEESLSALILHEWRTAERAFESLTRHSVASIAAAIPAESRNAAASLAVEFARLFADLAARLNPRLFDVSPSREPTPVEAR
jgi:Protein of unknown function (DUF3102)